MLPSPPRGSSLYGPRVLQVLVSLLRGPRAGTRLWVRIHGTQYPLSLPSCPPPVRQHRGTTVVLWFLPVQWTGTRTPSPDVSVSPGVRHRGSVRVRTPHFYDYGPKGYLCLGGFVPFTPGVFSTPPSPGTVLQGFREPSTPVTPLLALLGAGDCTTDVMVGKLLTQCTGV